MKPEQDEVETKVMNEEFSSPVYHHNLSDLIHFWFSKIVIGMYDERINYQHLYPPDKIEVDWNQGFRFNFSK